MSNEAQILHKREYIKAGAGAGKTFTITHKIGELVAQSKIRADKILAVTFTNAAASEMRDRIRSKLIASGLRGAAESVKEASISTIHGFGLALIERFAFEQGISPKPRQLTESEQDQLIRKALAEVTAIDDVLQELDRFGYSGGYKGSGYVTPVEQFKGQILSVIAKLRTLGKGELSDVDDLLTKAKEEISCLYGQNLSKATTLNQSLWSAIEYVRGERPDRDKVYAAWGSNNASRRFVDTLYSVSEEDIQQDWQAWMRLQTIKAPKIEKLGDLELAERVWFAADKLSVHPGPLEDAKARISALLNGAAESLQKYQLAKANAGLIDFNDMVSLAHQIMQQPECIEEMLGHYDCLIIDEFQDTNPLQFALLNHFQQAGVPTLIVGDLKQSIMGFQGSDARLFEGLLRKGDDCDDVHVTELTNNWRSTPEVMKFVNAMGAHLYGENYQALEVTPDAAYQSSLPAVHQLVFDTRYWASTAQSKNKLSMTNDSYHALAQHIYQLLAKGTSITDKHTGNKRPLLPSDIAVLGSKHSRLQGFSSVLNQWGISTKLTQCGFVSSSVIQWIFNGLKFVADTTNQFAILDLLTSNYAHATLQDLLNEFIKHRKFSHPVVDTLKTIAFEARTRDFGSAVSLVIDALDIWTLIQTRADYRQQRANVLKLIHLADEFENTQPETLEAMGIYGKNLNTFLLWITQSAENGDVDNQPHYDIDAKQSVTLSTWHASKGLEWPVVIVLNLHEESKVRFPSIDVNYESDDIEQMLDTSYVRCLFDFADNISSDKMKTALEIDNLNTLKNLCYVVLTRARESLILPWFDDDKPTASMLTLIKPLFGVQEFEWTTTTIKSIDEPPVQSDFHPTATELNNVGQPLNGVEPHSVNRVLNIQHCNRAKVVATVSPSTLHVMPSDDELDINSHQYGRKIDINLVESALTAAGKTSADLGTWIHKVFEVGIIRPAMFARCTKLLPEAARDVETISVVEEQVEQFKTWLQTLHPVSIACELPVLAQNCTGQNISGTIDLLVETENGYWIIDHKSDKQAEMQKHIEQLQSYAKVWSQMSEKPVIGIAINWVRFGMVESIFLT